jgi:hypothetical protein
VNYTTAELFASVLPRSLHLCTFKNLKQVLHQSSLRTYTRTNRHDKLKPSESRPEHRLASTEMYRAFSSVPPGTCWDSTSVRPRPLPSKGEASWRLENSERSCSQKLTPSLYLIGWILKLSWSLIFILTNQLRALTLLGIRLLWHLVSSVIERMVSISQDDMFFDTMLNTCYEHLHSEVYAAVKRQISNKNNLFLVTIAY